MSSVVVAAVIAAMVCLCVLSAFGAPGKSDSRSDQTDLAPARAPVFASAPAKRPANHSKSLVMARQDKPPAGQEDQAAVRVPGARSEPSDSIVLPEAFLPSLLSRDPLELLRLENIKPLYSSPALPGEGVWQSAASPRDSAGIPVAYTTLYRPSVQFPNAVVFMMVVDMSRVFIQYYVGSQEPAASVATSEVEEPMRPRLAAITNAMWMQKHSKGAGAIFRGKVIYPMVDEMATLILYKDGSVDIQEWSPDIPLDMVRDARQLRHLIVKNGSPVKTVLRNGNLEDAEIGLGFLLGKGGKDYEGGHFWFVAHRSAFGIREDGNLVFAIGHHIGTKDLAKALVLAGCKRAIHADANPANIVGNLYLRDTGGNLVAKTRLSPEQPKYALKRYDDGYTKDFFGFFFKSPGQPDTPAPPSKRSRKRAGL